MASNGALTIDGEFTYPVFYVGFLATAGPDRLDIFDAGGNLLGGTTGSNTFLSIGSAVPIARFRVTAVSGSITPGIDNLTFVPEPATVGLSAFGMTALAFFRTRQRCPSA